MTAAGTTSRPGMSLTIPPRRTDAVPALAALPVAIIGAGPVGLAAAADLRERGIDCIVFEAGAAAGSAIALWGHTRLFSPWRYLTSAASVRLLEPTGWVAPDPDVVPSGDELLADYVRPLAAVLSDRVRFNAQVTAVSRQGMDRTRSANRAATPFVLRVETDVGTHDALARAVIDTSGTYSTPNPLTASGLDLVPRAHDDSALQKHLVHALPDVLGTERSRFAGRHTVVVGAGHSAANTLLALADLASAEAGTTISWLIRTATPVRVYGGDDDELAARASLGSRVQALVTSGQVALITGFEIDDLALTPDPVTVSTTGPRNLPGSGSGDARIALIGRRGGVSARLEADLVVAATGFRPDLAMLREIRLSLDEIVEAPRLLAPLIDPNLHSCGTVPAHGVDVLTHPEPNFYLAGMKSFGRAPTFLLATGYEQVRSIADELAGNRAAARLVTLVLPETGVCCTTPPAAPTDTISPAAPMPALVPAALPPAASAACCT